MVKYKNFRYERLCPFCDQTLPSRRTFRAHLTKKHPNRKADAKTGKLASQWRTSAEGVRVTYHVPKEPPAKQYRDA